MMDDDESEEGEDDASISKIKGLAVTI